jgi:hypothetical protein
MPVNGYVCSVMQLCERVLLWRAGILKRSSSH